MRTRFGVSRAGAAVAVLSLSVITAGATAQTAAKAPPAKGDPIPQLKPAPRNIAPGVRVDGATGEMSEYVSGIQAVHIPYDGVFPDGHFPQVEREAGRPLRPGGDPWIPDGTGYWPQLSEDRPGPSSQPLMQNHEGPGPNGLNPPDPDMARGRDYQLCATNDDFAVYDSCGNELFYRDINDYLGISDFMFDPKVIFDPWNSRWVMMYHLKEDSPQSSRLVFVVSGNEIPFGVAGSSVWYYSVSVLQDGGTGDASWADYFDLGYSNSQISTAGNMFRFAGGFRWGRIMVFDKAAMYAAGSLGYWNWWNLTNADGTQTNTPRACKMQTSWSEGGFNIDAMFVNSRWGGGNRLTFWKARDVFSTNLLSKADTVVGNYTTPPDAVQPNGGSLDTIDCRLMTAIVSNDFLNGNGIELFTSLNTTRNGSDVGTLLYKFDAVSHALEFESNFGSAGFDYWFASSATDYSGSNFWVFTRTANSAGNEPEIRFVDMNQGVFSSSSSLIKDGTGSASGFRWGDYFGGELDWGDYWNNGGSSGQHKVWLYAEYGTPGSWGTHVGATSVFSQGSISSVSPGGAWVISGPPGGPFAPSSQVYTIGSASGDVGTAYTVTSLPSWLDSNKDYDQLWTSSTVTLSVNSNANGLALGTYNDTVSFVDCFNGGQSWNRSVQLNVQAPDLDVVSCLVVDGTYNPGDTVSVSGQYRNNGNLPTGNFTADFYASTNTTISPADTLLGSRNYASLAAGSTMNFGAHILTLPCMPEGNRYIGVLVTVANDADTSDNTGYDPTVIGYEYCGGDFNGDCNVNTIDVLAFLNAWAANQRAADCNGDGTINTIDVLCFLNLWAAGC
ncbi:MAG: hypothetical protein IT431_02085 [Phycisphaerales bacterium]|nr:hypothetical protein [Phycisphaerales bacterium]